MAASVANGFDNAVKDKLGDNVVTGILVAPSDLLRPNKVANGDGWVGFMLFWLSVLVIFVVLSIDKGYVRDILFFSPQANQVVDDIYEYVMNGNGGMVLLVVCSAFFGVVMNRRINRYQFSNNGWDLLVKPPIFTGRSMFGSGESYQNHPFYVTGASEYEYNDTKTISDNYLPTF